MRDKFINCLLTIVSCLIGLFICELAYRGYTDWREKGRWLQPQQFTVFSRSVWKFDLALGYDYRPGVHSDVAIMRNGVPRRCRSIIIDEHGSPGRGIGPEESKKPMFVVLGDSFTAMVHKGETWPDILSGLLEGQTGHAAPILNLSRDGYGVLQMFDQAAQLVREGYRPRAYIIAIIGPDLIRPRSWRMTLQRGGNDEVFMSSVPSLDVAPATHVRAAFIDPGATRTWCEALRASGKSDETAKRIEVEFDAIRRADEAFFRTKLNIFDLKECYICNRIRYGRPTKEVPANRYNPAHGLTRFQDDPRFAEALAVIRAGRVPVWLVYLPYEPELRTGNREMNSQERSLFESLTSEVDRTIDLMPTAPMGNAAFGLTMQPEDYHPSRLGLEYYSHEMARQLILFDHRSGENATK